MTFSSSFSPVIFLLFNERQCWWMQVCSNISSVIKQKRESQNGCYMKTKHTKFSEKPTFLYPWYAHAHVRIRGQEKSQHFLPPDTYMYVCASGGKKCWFFGKFGVLCFLVTPVLRFSLLPFDLRFEINF